MIDPQVSEAVPPCQAHPESVNARLAAFLNGKQEAVVQEWLNRMKNDAAIKTETLTTRELKAQLPALFEDLMKALCEYGSDAVAQKSDLDSARHGAMRWRQGYDL
ncbi:MAG TPA: RsbRD N-terminal domain-containing protein, partial [Prosthecobacter sp.]|nr:RsbRD N-terminal domain-containing protein [Prosthecobacter sp.]